MNKFERLLLTLVFIEIFIGGGGRLIDFGIISVRQLLFVTLLLTFLYRILAKKNLFNKEVNTFFRFTPATIGIYLLIGSFIISALIGFNNGHDLSIIVMDFFRVSYFLAYFPLVYYITDDRFSFKRVIKILKYSALAVAIFTITITLLGKTVFVNNFDVYYDFMNTIMNDDLFFRPSNSLFYKSHLFVVLGFIISLNAVLAKAYTKLDVAIVIFCSASALWSETRGFLLAIMISILMIIIIDIKLVIDPVKGFIGKLRTLVDSKQFIKKTIILILVFVTVPFLYDFMTMERFTETVEEDSAQAEEEKVYLDENNNIVEHDKSKEQLNDVSVNARLEFIYDSKRILLDSPTNFIFGTGYGTEIDGRVNGIEMSFLDIFVEQGLIGLLIWMFLFLLVYLNYYLIYRRGGKIHTTEISLLAAFMGLLLLTNINPFINNPIGIIFFLIILVFSQNRIDQEENNLNKEVIND